MSTENENQFIADLETIIKFMYEIMTDEQREIAGVLAIMSELSGVPLLDALILIIETLDLTQYEKLNELVQSLPTMIEFKNQFIPDPTPDDLSVPGGADGDVYAEACRICTAFKGRQHAHLCSPSKRAMARAKEAEAKVAAKAEADSTVKEVVEIMKNLGFAVLTVDKIA